MVYEPFEYGGINVPVGFVTDLCSIPALCRAFLPVAGRVSKPAVLHDWLLKRGEIEAANEVFAHALHEAGVPPLSRWLMVAAVRLWWAIKRLGSVQGYQS